MKASRPSTVSRVADARRFTTRLQGLEQLESRNLLAVTVSSIQLATDTGSSDTDKISSAATLSGTTAGSPQFGATAQIQFDHKGDGTVNGSATVASGAFNYNPVAVDSTLENWEASLLIKYRTRELDGYGGQVSVGDWQNFNMTLDRKSPTGSLAALNVDQDAPNSNISLHAAFADGVTADSALVYQIVGNTNPNLFTSVTISSGTLTLDHARYWFGNANIVIRATDQAGNTKDATLAVSVNQVSVPPVIVSFTIIELDTDLYGFEGLVIDDSDLTGFFVLIWVVDPDEYLLAEIQANGTFSTTFACQNPGTLALSLACDGEGLWSEEAWAVFT